MDNPALIANISFARKRCDIVNVNREAAASRNSPAR